MKLFSLFIFLILPFQITQAADFCSLQGKNIAPEMSALLLSKGYQVVSQDANLTWDSEEEQYQCSRDQCGQTYHVRIGEAAHQNVLIAVDVDSALFTQRNFKNDLEGPLRAIHALPSCKKLENEFSTLRHDIPFHSGENVPIHHYRFIRF